MSEKRKRKHENVDASLVEVPQKSEEKLLDESPSSTRAHRVREAIELSKIELPKTADGLTAEKLSSEQKNVFKRECQRLYGHKFSTKRKLPANSLEVATLQLQAKMKEKAALLKNKKAKVEK